MMRFLGLASGFAAIGLLASGLAAVAAEASKGPDAVGRGYEYYAIGDVKAATPGHITPLLGLFGGGDWPKEAFREFVAHAGGGHIVVLRARGARELQDEIYNDVGGVASVETLVIHDEDAVEDPKLLAVLAHADGIFLGGGDQSNYVRLWKSTSINRLIDAHIKAGRPIGGTSAGLAVLGGYVYSCLDTVSMTSPEAMKNPTGPGITLTRDFLHLPGLSHVITDSHFGIRDRLGRLVTFVARLKQEDHDPLVTGLGVDEGTGLLIDASGVGRFYGPDKTYAWLVQSSTMPGTIIAGQPLDFGPVTVTGIGPGSRLELKDFKVTAPAFSFTLKVDKGVMTRSDK